MEFYHEGSGWEIITFAVLTLGALIFQIGYGIAADSSDNVFTTGSFK
jgi:hypothetical protein